MKPFSLWITLGLVLAALALGAGSSWVVRGWRDDAAQLATAQKDVKDIKAASDELVAAQIKARDKLQLDNNATAANVAQLSTDLGKQANALRKLQTTFAGISIGSCTFNADGDQLLKQSYQAAFPVPGPAKAGPAR